MSKDMLIQSQQVTLTGTDADLKWVLRSLKLWADDLGVTVTLTPTSVPDATAGVTRDSQQNPQQQEIAEASDGH